MTNSETVSALADWYDSVFISNDQVWDNSDTYVTEIWTGSNTPLGAGVSYIINQNIVLPQTAAGDRYLLFVADRYNYQGETNETDNVVAKAISLSAPNLKVTDITAPTAITQGSGFNVSWTVNNDSTYSALFDWRDRLYLSSDDVWDSGDRQLDSVDITSQTPLVGGSSYTINRTNLKFSGVSDGTYYLIVKTDENNAQPETNETDNTLAAQITVNSGTTMYEPQPIAVILVTIL